MHFPSLDEFVSLARHGNLIPVCREILADMETPVSAFRKIDDGRTSFLLESIQGGEKWARYSFLGTGPGRMFRSKDRYFEIIEDGAVVESGQCDDPLQKLSALMAAFNPVELPGLPRFSGGAVGYLGYDVVRFVEQLPDSNRREIDTWDSSFLFTEKLLIFDNVTQKIFVVCNVHLAEEENPAEAYRRGLFEVERLIERLRSPLHLPEQKATVGAALPLVANFDKEAFKAAVEKCKEYVRAGDVFQVVLSQRFSGPLQMDPFDIYRALRTINPSPYMFYLSFGETKVVGASPEVLVRKEGRRAELRPIAGTRPRGADVAADLA